MCTLRIMHVGAVPIEQKQQHNRDYEEHLGLQQAQIDQEREYEQDREGKTSADARPAAAPSPAIEAAAAAVPVPAPAPAALAPNESKEVKQKEREEKAMVNGRPAPALSPPIEVESAAVPAPPRPPFPVPPIVNPPVAARTRSRQPNVDYADVLSPLADANARQRDVIALRRDIRENVVSVPVPSTRHQESQRQQRAASAQDQGSAIADFVANVADLPQRQRVCRPSQRSGNQQQAGRQAAVPIRTSNRFGALSIDDDGDSGQAAARVAAARGQPAARGRAAAARGQAGAGKRGGRGPDKAPRRPRGAARAGSQSARRSARSENAQRQRHPVDDQPPADHDPSTLPSPATLAAHGRMFASVPRHCQRAFQRAALPILRSYMRASHERNESEKTHWGVQLLALPALALGRAGSTKKVGTQAINERLRQLQRELENGERNVAGRLWARTKTQATDQKLASVKRAMGLARSGFVGRAAQALTQQGMHDPNNEDVISELVSLHPPCPDAMPGLPADAPSIIISTATEKSKKELRQIISRLANGSAGGPSGFTGAHLKALSSDDDCLRGIAVVMQDICNGEVNSTLRGYLLSSTLYPLTKANSGVRPIAVGEVLKRAADSYINRAVAPAAKEICQPYQFGICTPGGCEKVVLATQALLDSPGHTKTAFLVDIKNAFNTENRAKLLSAVYKKPELSRMWRIANFTYGSESTLRLPNGREIPSRNGVKQGDTLGSVQFAVGKHDGYAAAHARHPDTVRLFALLDDATFVGPDQHVVECVAELERQIQDHGQEFNWSKCKFLAHPDNELAPAVTEFLRAHNVPIVRDATLLLGAPVGFDRSKMADMVVDIHKESALLFEQLQHHALPVQEAMLMLRSCAVPIPVYLSRVMPPEVFANAAAAFDRQVLDTAAQKMKLPLPLTAAVVQQLQHKLSSGGFGFTAMTQLSPIAYTSALSAAASVLCEPIVLPEGTPHPDTRFSSDLKSALQATRRAVILPEPADAGRGQSPINPASIFLPPADDDHESKALRWFAENAPQNTDPEAKMQRTLVYAADSKRFTQFLQTAQPADRARLLSCSGPSAAAWLTAIPSDSHTRLHSKAYQAAARLRLGLPVFDETGSKCVCGSQNADPAIDLHHALSCIKVRRGAVNFRHDMVKNVVHHWAKHMGCPAIMEPKNLVKGQERADNLIVMPSGDSFLCDVAIVQPSAPTHISTGKAQLAVADAAAAAKRAQYTEMANEEGAEFVPIIAEVFGALHEDAIKFFKQLANLAVEDASCPWDRLEALIAIKSAVAVAIQKGNFQAFSRVQQNNRVAGFVISRRRIIAQSSGGPRAAESVNAQAAELAAAEPAAAVPAAAEPAAAPADRESGAPAEPEVQIIQVHRNPPDVFGGEAVGPSPFDDERNVLVRIPGNLAAAVGFAADAGGLAFDDEAADAAHSRHV